MEDKKTLRKKEVNTLVEHTFAQILNPDINMSRYSDNLDAEYLFNFEIVKYGSKPEENKTIYEIFDKMINYYGLELLKKGIKTRLEYHLENEHELPYCDLGHSCFCKCKNKRFHHTLEEKIAMLLNQFKLYSQSLPYDSRRQRDIYDKEYLACNITLNKHCCDYYNNLVNNNDNIHFAGLYFFDMDEEDYSSDDDY
jgi:hypothetical protein